MTWSTHVLPAVAAGDKNCWWGVVGLIDGVLGSPPPRKKENWSYKNILNTSKHCMNIIVYFTLASLQSSVNAHSLESSDGLFEKHIKIPPWVAILCAPDQWCCFSYFLPPHDGTIQQINQKGNLPQHKATTCWEEIDR